MLEHVMSIIDYYYYYYYCNTRYYPLARSAMPDFLLGGFSLVAWFCRVAFAAKHLTVAAASSGLAVHTLSV